MPKIALITDTHFGSRGDSIIFLDYMEKFYKEIFFPYLEKNEINIVIHLGDVFDRRKFVNFVTLKRSKEMFFDELKKRNIFSYIIAGNHDCFYKNTNSINNIELIVQHYAMDNIHPIINHPELINIGGIDFAMVPWICPENEKECIKFIKQCPTDLCFGHFAINGFAMYQGHIEEHGLSKDLFDKFDMVFSGHFHHKSSNGKIYYLGNPYEITWSDYNDRKGFHIFDTETRNLEFIENSFHMFHKITYNEHFPFFKSKSYIHQKEFFDRFPGTYVKVISETKTNIKEYENFLNLLYETNPFNIDLIETYSDVIELEMDDETTENTAALIETYIDSSSIDDSLNKKILKKYMMEAYHQALNE